MAFDKDYITDTCDLVVAALSNRTGATMTIYQYREESVTMGRDSNVHIHMVRRGE